MHGAYCDQHVAGAEGEIGDEEEEVAIVFHSNAVVNPGTMMVHQAHTLLADSAMMRPCWLHSFANGAFFIPAG